MKMNLDARALGAGLIAVIVLGACSQGAAPQTGGSAPPGPTTVAEIPTAAGTPDPRFNATAAVGGGINASNVVSADDVKAAFGAVPQIDQLKLSLNSSPPGARGTDVTSVSIVAQDSGGVLKAMDQAAKRSLAEAILNGAAGAWPKSSISLLLSDPTGGGGQIIGSHSPGGPNTVIVS
jgi:hypothetical protein